MAQKIMPTVEIGAPLRSNTPFSHLYDKKKSETCPLKHRDCIHLKLLFALNSSWIIPKRCKRVEGNEMNYYDQSCFICLWPSNSNCGRWGT